MARLEHIAEIAKGDPKICQLLPVDIPESLALPTRVKVIKIKVSGPEAERIAGEIWRSLSYCAEKLNDRKAPNMVALEAGGE